MKQKMLANNREKGERKQKCTNDDDKVRMQQMQRETIV